MDILTLVLILLADIFSIACGVYLLIVFIRIYLDKGDLMKNKNYLINAFILIIVFPLIITGVGVMISNYYGYTPFDVSVEMESAGPESDFRIQREEGLYSIDISNPSRSEYSVELSCPNREDSCKNMIEMILPEKKVITTEPLFRIEVPFKIKISDSESGDYNVSLKVSEVNGSTITESTIKFSLIS